MDDSSVIESDPTVVVQHTGLDSREQAFELVTTMAYRQDDEVWPSTRYAARGSSPLM